MDDPDDTATPLPDVDAVRALIGARPTTSRALVATLQISEDRVLTALRAIGAKRTAFGWSR
jgi:hypothetical protein